MPTFPGTITPVLRFDGTQPAYQDLAQTIPANVAGQPVRSVPQPSPLSGAWTAPSDAERPSFDSSGAIVSQPCALDSPTHSGQYLLSPTPAAPISLNSSTVAMSFRAFASYGALPNALVGYGGIWGLLLTGNGISCGYGPQWDSGVRLGKDMNAATVSGDSGPGNLICVVARYTPTGIDIYVDEEGTVFTNSISTTITGGVVPDVIRLGYAGNGYGNAMYGQAVVINSTISDADRLALINFLKASSIAPAFPVSKPYIGVLADSIGEGVGSAGTPTTWVYRMLANLLPTYPTIRLCNTSIVGSGVVTIRPPYSTQYDTHIARLSASRAQNVAIVALGTNDMTSDPSNSGVDAALVNLYALCDALRAHGAKVAVAAVLPRSGLLGSTTQSAWTAARTRFNNALAAAWSSHADAFVDLRTIVGMGADGDSNGANYTSDNVHPSVAGYALLEPAYTAAVSALLAGTSIPAAPSGLTLSVV